MHDRKGQLLHIGDKVTVECTVRNLSANPDYCNITVVADMPAELDMSQAGSAPILTCNSKYFTKVDAGELVDAA